MDQNNTKILVRELIPNDVRVIWEWRNDELTRKMSSDEEYISFEDHELWFKKIFTDSNYWVYIGEINENPFGICHIKRTAQRTAEVSLNICPKNRQSGLGRALLTSSLARFSNAWQGILLAYIKPENDRSQKCFIHAGFSKSGSQGELLRYEKVISAIN